MHARMLERNRKSTMGALIAAMMTWAFCMGAAPEVRAPAREEVWRSR